MPLRYLAVYVLVAIGTASLFTTGLATFTLPLLVFGLIPLAELAMPGTPENISQKEAQERLASRSYDAVLYMAIPALFGVLGVLLWRVDSGALTGWSLVGGVATTGVLIAALGLNAGHELGHRSQRGHQRASKILYLPALYMHFFIEHNLGHHMRVATDDDPASARRGDWLYARWVRSIAGGFRSAWSIESDRVTRAGHSSLSLHNEVLRFFLIEAAALVAVALLISPLAAIAWMGAALVGVLMLETVNYVEHYGLRRELTAVGRHERVRPRHSWNSNHTIGRVLLFDLTRHSDHHANPRRPYPLLRHFDDAPQLPTGYPGMMLLSAFPPLFHAVMHRELDRVEAGSEAGAVPA